MVACTKYPSKSALLNKKVYRGALFKIGLALTWIRYVLDTQKNLSLWQIFLIVGYMSDTHRKGHLMNQRQILLLDLLNKCQKGYCWMRFRHKSDKQKTPRKQNCLLSGVHFQQKDPNRKLCCLYIFPSKIFRTYCMLFSSRTTYSKFHSF